jgi:NAD(P)-dependent dehydrogenase (short-subunit alcohol dehydrogenase family)
MAGPRPKGRYMFATKTVIVTGASSGIGRETARAFARAGANVIVAARNAAKLNELVEAERAPGERLLAVPCDVTRDDDVRRMVDAALARFGRVDILVNNAGIGMRAPIDQVRFADAQRVMEVNFFGALRCIQAVLPHMKRQTPAAGGNLRGQIVNVGSVLSLLATPRNGIYAASKFALRGLSDALRIELRATGIDVILVMPGYTDTPFFDSLIRYEGPARISPVAGQHPAKVADAILRACARRQREVVLTLPGKFGAWMKRWFPRLVDWGLARVKQT